MSRKSTNNFSNCVHYDSKDLVNTIFIGKFVARHLWSTVQLTPMKKTILTIILAAAMLWPAAAQSPAEDPYVPTEENMRSRREFAGDAFGIFLHWGIYSMFGQGEWYLNYGPTAREYAKAARGFYPAYFDAKAWVSAIKDSGAKYICITTRHHDGFSMWDTACSDYNIVKATPFGRDILRELADECQRQGLRLHLYYSHLDWTRPDYPMGRTGRTTGRPEGRADWDSYFNFMNSQLTELLTQYGPIGAIWFDGYWDHDEDEVPFDWHLREQYDLIHSLQPACLIGNNHHVNVHPGEDIQIFERDVPGQNTAGYSGDMDISSLPLETCQTMNGMWGYKIKDQDYKSVPELVRYLVSTAGMGANLLLNIGPQPSGELPEAALERLKGIGQWLRTYGETVYDTTAGDFPAQDWGTSTRRGDTLYVHVTNASTPDIHLPMKAEIVSASAFDTGEKVNYTPDARRGGYTLHLSDKPEAIDYIIVLKTKP